MEGDVPEESSLRRPPTTNEVELILRPYRTDALRQRAAQIREHDYTQIPIFRRTHNSVHEDERTIGDELMVQWASRANWSTKSSGQRSMT